MHGTVKAQPLIQQQSLEIIRGDYCYGRYNLQPTLHLF